MAVTNDAFLDRVEAIAVNDSNISAKAKRTLLAGEFIGIFDGTLTSTPSRLTLCIREGVHVLNDSPLVRMNHSCVPNSGFEWEESNSSEGPVAFPRVVVLQRIEAGEDITFNYCTTEWSMAAPFDCLCGHESCFGRIKGYSVINAEQRRMIEQLIAPHIKRMRAVSNETTA